MVRDTAHNVHPEDTIFSNSNTALNKTKYAIARRQPAYGFTAKFGRDRWGNTAEAPCETGPTILKFGSFNNETLEPFVVTTKSGMHPTRMEWRQQASGRKTSAHEAATSHTVLCPAKCGTQTDIRIKTMRQQTGWPIMVCHGVRERVFYQDRDVQQVQDGDAQVQMHCHQHQSSQPTAAE